LWYTRLVNIFVLDNSPQLAARDMCNKHICKMCVETAQMLSAAVFLNNDEQTWNLYQHELYKPTHKKHPCTLWTAKSPHNFEWLVQHAFALCDEYTTRYGKTHASKLPIKCAASLALRAFGGVQGDWTKHTPFALAMPDECKREDAVEAYRCYYVAHKAKFAKWEPRAREPEWWKKCTLDAGVV